MICSRDAIEEMIASDWLEAYQDDDTGIKYRLSAKGLEEAERRHHANMINRCPLIDLRRN